MEVERNWPTLLRAATRIHEMRPDTRFLVASFKKSHQHAIEQSLRKNGLPIQVHTDKTPEIIHLAHACIAVSGSVGLELLYHATPSVVIYRVTRMFRMIMEPLLTTKFISLVNLLAEQKLFPEYPSDRCEAEAASKDILHWLDHPTEHESIVQQLVRLRRLVAKPGACNRAAEYIYRTLCGTMPENHAGALKVSA
jgi:lipid-A-disaccharide synthase